MGMLAFMPWCTVASQRTIGDFTLIPVERGAPRPPIVDSVLKPYADSDGIVRRGTLIQVSGRALTDDLDEAERGAVFAFAEVMAFAGLARRRFFEYGGYVNTDTFACYIQAFHETIEGTSVRARRRHGYQLTGYPTDAFRAPRPAHVETADAYEPDETLISSLLRAFDSDKAQPYEDAIFSFQWANTDSDRLPPQAEVVFTVGAFERIAGCRRGKAKDLARRLGTCLEPYLARRACKRLATINRLERANSWDESASIVEAWIHDLYRVRNAFGHGRKAEKRQPIWSLEAHLLLGAFLFPRALMIRLANEGFYSLTDDDKRDLFGFAYLVCLKEPRRMRTLGGAPLTSAWNSALSAASWDLWRDEMMSKFPDTKGEP